MNVLERTLVTKAGRENGWEYVVESSEYRVVLGSARHRGRATVLASGTTPQLRLEFHEPRLTRELDRSLPGLVADAGSFIAADFDTLSAILLRAAELAQSLPDQAAQDFRDRCAKSPALASARGTEVERVVRQRIGQDVFRNALLDYWGHACAVTGLALPEVLRASHTKPWSACDTDNERLDVFNGFLLVAHLDALFDGGLITFDIDMKLIISDRLRSEHREQLHLHDSMRLRWMAPEHDRYLQWHRVNLFR
jgi:putative restriction endonuclease